MAIGAPKRSVKSIMRAIMAILAVLAGLLLLGQGCLYEDPQNGGGYGGLTPINNGPYLPASPPTSPSVNGPIPYFYLIGTQNNCTSYPSGWQEAGPDIVGIIAFGTVGTSYAPSICTGYTSIEFSDLNIADFDQNVAIYNNQIYRYFVGLPPNPSEFVTPIAYCRDITSTLNGVELGTDVSVFSSNSGTLGEIFIGQNVNGAPAQFSVSPFTVTSTINTNSATYAAGSFFQLAISRNGSPMTTGILTAVLNGNSEVLNMTCWVTTP